MKKSKSLAKSAKPAKSAAASKKAAVKTAPAKPSKASAKPAPKAAAKPAKTVMPAKVAKPAAPKKAAPVKGKPAVAKPAKVLAKPAAAVKAAPKAVAPAKPAKAVKPAEKSDLKIDKKAMKSVEAEVAKKAKLVQPKAAKVEAKPIVMEEPEQAEDVVLTDAEGRRYCRVKDCDRLAEVDAYCRYHYILLWKNIQTRRHILQEGKLERYIEELTARYPDKFLEILKKDLRSEKDFLAAIQELEIDESAVEAEFDDEESQSDLFEIQRVSDSGGGGARSEEDDRF